jgi:hypothetical protein
MSLLDGPASDDNATDSEARDALAGAGDDKEPAEEAAPPAPEPPKPVVLEKPKSRRDRIEEQYNTRLKEVSDNVAKLSEGISARDRQIGELTGHIQALSLRPAYQPPPQYQQPQQQLPDPEELERKAQEAIDRKDFTGYQRLTRAAAVADTLRAMQPILARQQQMQAPQQDQVPPALMPYFAAYPEVASHPAAMQLLAAKNVELEARGFRAGPERVRQIFEDVRATLKGGQAPAGAPAYSSHSAAVLAGTPTSRPAGGASSAEGKARVELTQEERYFAKKAGFSELEIASEIAKSHPDRVLR